MVARSLRPFVGSRDFEVSRAFYRTIGFEELPLGEAMSLFSMPDTTTAFYLQDYYVKEWVENTMLFLEVEDPEAYLAHLGTLDLNVAYPTVKLSQMQQQAWGREFFLHDPAGVLWHIGAFTPPASATPER